MNASNPQVLARSFFSELRGTGLSHNQVINVASELLELVMEERKAERAAQEAAAQAEKQSRQMV